MTDVVKLRFSTAKRWITYVLRLTSYVILVFGGLAALVSPPATIVDSLGSLLVRTLAIFLLIGSAVLATGWASGRWLLEQIGAVVATVGAALYFLGTILSPDVLSLGGGIRIAFTLYVAVALLLRVFEIERYTSITVVPGRMRLETI